MGDEIELRDIQVIQDGLIQMDFFNESEHKGYRAFCKPDIFFKMIGDSMAQNHRNYPKIGPQKRF